jgi:hypothetical protein
VLRVACAFCFALVVGCLGVGAMLIRGSAMSSVAAPLVPPKPTAAVAPASVERGPEPMRQLPEWVQTRRVAVMFSGADGEAVRHDALPTWTFLQVTGVQGDRLRVNDLGDGKSRRAGPGWVEVDDVQPSDQGGDWLRNHRPSRIVDTGGSASGVAVPQWSWLLALERTRPGLVRVRAYAPDLRSVLAEGWLPVEDIGPTGPPDRGVYTASLRAPAGGFASHDAFISTVGSAARQLQAETGVPASVTVAQAILESDWGGSLLTRQANNFFGIKAMGRLGNDGAVWMRTMEYGDDGPYQVMAPFRAYKSLSDSLLDHADLFRRLSLYRRAMQATDDPNEFARRIAAAGYSTDPAYAQKLIGLMQRYELYRFDAPHAPTSPTNAA